MNFLPGWSIPVVSESQILLTQIASDAVAVEVEVPVTVQAGDLIILAGAAASTNTDTPDTQTPTGFTEISVFTFTGSNASRMSYYYKIAVGTESGQALRPFIDPDDVRVAFVLILRPSRTIKNVSLVDFNSISSTGDPADIAVGSTFDFNFSGMLFSSYNGLDLSDITSSHVADGSLTDSDDDNPSPASRIDAEFQWHLWFPIDTAEAVTIGIDGSTDSRASLSGIALLVT